jgi:hypothetical protein
MKLEHLRGFGWLFSGSVPKTLNGWGEDKQRSHVTIDIEVRRFVRKALLGFLQLDLATYSSIG